MHLSGPFSRLRVTAPSGTALFRICLLAFAAWAAWLFFQQSRLGIVYPYPLDYGEGAVLDQAMRLFGRQTIYRTNFSAPPYVINVYPPVYLAAQIPFLALWGPAFWYGRLISVLSALATALLITATLHEFLRSWERSALAGLTFMVIPYVLHWAHLFRVDTLALFLSWAGLFVIVRWPKERWSLFAAAGLMVASVYTRQSYVLAAPLASFCWLWSQNNWKRAATFAALTGSLILGIFVLLNVATGSAFFYNTITVLNKQTLNMATLWYFVLEVSEHLPILLVAAGGLVITQIPRANRNGAAALILPYLAGSLISALTISKPGSNVNYLLEFAAAISFAAILLIDWLKRWPWLHILGLALLAVQIYSLAVWLGTDYYQARLADPHMENEQIMQLIHQTSGPVLTDEYIGLLLLDHRPVYIQPFDFTMLAQNGMWDQQPFLDMLDRREFALIILYDQSTGLLRQRWTKQMLEHIRQNYQQIHPLTTDVDPGGFDEIYVKRP